MTARPRLRGLIGISTVAGLAAAGVVAVSAPAHAVPAPDSCPAAFPISSLVEGQGVEGLTTTRGTTPEGFTGTYIDTIEDGIGRGRDLLVVRLEGSRITGSEGRSGAGIWAGISGSPVYDPHTGQLIGAVSYAFNDGNDPLAGVTPASYLYGLKPVTSPDTIALRSTRAALARQDVDVSSGASLKRLATPRQVSGFTAGTIAVARRIAARAGVDGAGLRAGGAARGSSTAYPLVAGGNVASTWSYGDITAAAIGSVTAVCDDDVYAFGHPDDWSGESTSTLHGASAVDISSGWFSYKLANVGAPVGALLQDRLEGLYGKIGTPPVSVDLRSTTTLGGRTTPGSSQVTERDELPYIAALQVASDTLTAQNAESAGGESQISWKISFTRANGTQRTFTRSQRYSTRTYLPDAVVSDVASDVEMIQDNDFENVKITKIDVTNKLASSYRAYKIASVDRKIGSRITRVKNGGRLSVKRGKPVTLRFNLAPADRHSTVTKTTRWLTFTTSKRAGGAGLVTVAGNAYDWMDDYEDYEDFADLADWDDDDEPNPYVRAPKAPKNLDQLLAAAARSPRQDDLTITSGWRSRFTGRLGTYEKNLRLPAVVSGDFSFRVAYHR